MLPILLSVGYWAIGVLESKLQNTGEPFNLRQTVETVGAGVVIGCLQGIAGLPVDPASIGTWTAFDGLAVIAITKFLNNTAASSNPVSSNPVSSTAAAVTPAIAPPAQVKASVTYGKTIPFAGLTVNLMYPGIGIDSSQYPAGSDDALHADANL